MVLIFLPQHRINTKWCGKNLVKAEEFIKHERDTENYIKERIDDNIMESDVLNLSLNTRSTKSVTYKKDCKGLGQYFKIKATYTINGKKLLKQKVHPLFIKQQQM